MELSDRFTDALAWAATLHRRQQRKVSGTPYVAHLLRVAGIVLDYGADEDEAIAALLHDAIEDQGGETARDEIRRRFGDRVVAIVEGATDTGVQPKPPWRQRKEAHVAHVRDASPSVRLVIAADKLDNVRSLLMEYHRRGESLWDFFHGRRDGTLWYYHAMTEALNARDATPLTEELQRAMDALDHEVER